jgi:hypothetical protein
MATPSSSMTRLALPRQLLITGNYKTHGKQLEAFFFGITHYYRSYIVIYLLRKCTAQGWRELLFDAGIAARSKIFGT